MTYQTGTASSMADLVTTIDTFITGTPGWTQDELNVGTGRAAWHKGDQYISVRWDTGTPDTLAIYHARGWSAATDPGNHTGDDGQGLISGAEASLQDSRGAYKIGDGPYTSYHFFTDASQTDFKCVLEFTPGTYRHFGWGSLDKLGDWTGGEYCYGHAQRNADPKSAANSLLLDGAFSATSGNQERQGGTVYAELNGLVDDWPGASTSWIVMHSTSTSPFPVNDRAGNEKAKGEGGSRSGPIAKAFSWNRSNEANGYVPLTPIPVFYWSFDISPNPFVFLGWMKDVRLINIGGFQAKQEVVVGSDTWVLFPAARKQYTASSPPIEESRHLGYAYKKVL